MHEDFFKNRNAVYTYCTVLIWEFYRSIARTDREEEEVSNHALREEEEEEEEEGTAIVTLWWWVA